MQYTNLYSQFSILSHHFFRLTLLSVLLLGITCIPQKARAQVFVPITTAPLPDDPNPRGGNLGISIEGINEIIATTDDADLINVSNEFTVDGLDNLPNPDNVIGEGNLLDVLKSAGNVWETAFPDFTENVSLRVGWADFSSNESLNLNGSIALYIHGDNNFPNTKTDGFPSVPGLDGLILFNSQLIETDVDGDNKKERILLYLDDNPFDSDVFGSLQSEQTRDLRDAEGNIINFGRSTFRKPSDFPGANEDDFVVDAFSLVLHELQHSLGLSESNPDAINTLIEDDSNSNGLLSDLNINIDSLDTTIPTTFDRTASVSSLHIFDDLDGMAEEGTPLTKTIFENQIATPVGLEFATNSERKCPSEADVLAVAAINGFENPVLNPCQALVSASVPVPEPSGIISLIMVGFGGLWVSRHRMYGVSAQAIRL